MGEGGLDGFEEETMARINEVLGQDSLGVLLRRLSSQFRSLLRHVGYRPERHYMRGRH